MTTGILRASDGVVIAFERWPGTSAVTALYVHATGFCKEIWIPVRDELVSSGADIGGLAIDQRGHGDSDLPTSSLHWSALGHDAVLAAGAVDGPVVGVGHSSGGAALCMAEAFAPGTFLALVLIEPIVFPGPHVRVDDNPLTERALKRRRSFASAHEAAAGFKEKAAFAGWRPEAIDAYVHHGFRADEEGRWVLKCSPETEAEFYREGTSHDTWERLPEVACPVLILAGERSDTHSTAFVEQLVARFPDAMARVVPGASHFLPMERPEAVALAVAQMLP